MVKKQNNLLSTQSSWIRALEKNKLHFFNALKLLILRSRVNKIREEQ